jgi:hypothetical protein
MNKPFFNGVNCINCTEPSNIFNLETKTCTSCPPQTAYNQTNKNCTAIPIDKTKLKPNVTAINGFNRVILNEYDIPCPDETPFYDGNGCINCTKNAPYFN